MSSIWSRGEFAGAWRRASRRAWLGALLLALARPTGAVRAESGAPAARQIESFNAAKKALREIYANHRRTVYSGCAYDEQMRVIYAECGYRPTKLTARALRIEWEHMVPAEAFGQAFVEWRKGHPSCVDSRGKPFRGRHCAAKASEQSRRIEADMHNLYPEVGELNARRSNFSMAELPNNFLLAGVAIKVGEAKFEPRPEAKGDVARTYFYMDEAYPGLGLVSEKNRKLFAAWSRLDSADDWECVRARRITEIQGRINQVLESACRDRGRS